MTSLYCLCLSSVVFRLSTFSNIFSDTTGLIEVKFHVEHPWDGGTKVCSRGPGHMTKMATMPILGKNPSKIFFSQTSRLICHETWYISSAPIVPAYTTYIALGTRANRSLFK